MSRLTRKEMKRDEVREGLGAAVDYARSHGRQVVLGMAVVAVAALAVGGWLAYRNHRTNEANEALAAALRIHGAEIDSVAPDPEDPRAPSFADEASREAAARTAFEAVRDRFPGSRVTAVAEAYLAETAALEGDLGTARELWGELEGTRASALTAAMTLNRLALDRAEGRGEEVIAELETMLDSASAPLPTVVILDQLALTLEDLGRVEEARGVYEQVLEEYPQSSLSQRARTQVAAL